MSNETNNHTSILPTDLEQGSCNESLGAQTIARFDRPVSVAVHSKRKRLTDSDGACIKYALDAIVDCGVLLDDSPNEIPQSPIKTQEQTNGREYTVITISDE